MLKRVVSAVQRLYPKELADSSWDNTGLLLEALESPAAATPRILLAIDLTAEVCTEAIKSNCNVIIAYHPFIFRGLKSVTTSDPQQVSLMRLVQHNISVYCPHTAVDAAKGGVNDWLADGITEGGKNEVHRKFLEPVSHPTIEAGMGRYVQFKDPLMLPQLVDRVKQHLGLDTVQVVQAEDHKTKPIKSVALCAGSGGSVVRGTDADLVFTGELGHHEMLYLRETGKSAIVCGHSNTERGFLVELRRQLERELASASERSELGEPKGASASASSAVQVIISQKDRDPIEYW